MRLTRKIALLVAVPLVAMAVFAGLAISVAVADGQRAERLATLVTLAQRSAGLAGALQAERAAAVSLLVNPGPAMTDRTEGYLATIGATDAAVAAYWALLSSAPVPSPAAAAVDRLSSQLELLTEVRGQVQAGTAAASAVAFRYRIVIASTVDYREVVAQAGQAPAEVAELVRSSVDVSRAAEALGLQQVAVLRALDAGGLTPASAAEITATRTAFTEAVVSFTDSAPVQWRGWWSRAATGSEVLAAQQLQDSVFRAATGDALGIDATRWVATMARRIELVHGVEGQADAAVLAAVAELRDSAVRRAVLVSLGVLAAALFAVGLAIFLGRPVVADLRQLRDLARAVAYERLPELVGQLNRTREWRDGDLDRLVASAPSTGVRGSHEVGEVGLAFDEVFRAAVRSAAELARARLGVSQMLVALARRIQRRTSQMTVLLDGAERDEQDEAKLAFLFNIDSLNTLAGRTAEELLVLGGHGPGKVRPGTVAMLDVLMGAASRIEFYARVRIGAIESDLAVAGHVADELMLLLAQLMENATTLSQDWVRVSAQALADRVVVQVVDTGIGLPEGRRRDLNERLRNPVVDVDAVAQMGLTVAGVLAAHHGLRVELRANHPVGMIAEVTIPGTLLRRSGAAPVPVVKAYQEPHRAEALAIGARPTPGPRAPLEDRMPWPAAVVESTAELPIFAELSGTGAPRGTEVVAGHRGIEHGLPVRMPQSNQFPDRQLMPRWVPPRDPAEVAAAMSAYARGVSASRSHHSHRTDNQGT